MTSPSTNALHASGDPGAPPATDKLLWSFWIHKHYAGIAPLGHQSRLAHTGGEEPKCLVHTALLAPFFHQASAKFLHTSGNLLAFFLFQDTWSLDVQTNLPVEEDGVQALRICQVKSIGPVHPRVDLSSSNVL